MDLNGSVETGYIYNYQYDQINVGSTGSLKVNNQVYNWGSINVDGGAFEVNGGIFLYGRQQAAPVPTGYDNTDLGALNLTGVKGAKAGYLMLGRQREGSNGKMTNAYVNLTNSEFTIGELFYGVDVAGYTKRALPESAAIWNERQRWVTEAYEELTEMEQEIIGLHLGFCGNCFYRNMRISI